MATTDLRQEIAAEIRRIEGISYEFRQAAANGYIDTIENQPGMIDALSTDQVIQLSSFIGEDPASNANRHELYSSVNLDAFPDFQQWHDQKLADFKDALKDDAQFSKHLREGLPEDPQALKDAAQHYVDLYTEQMGIKAPDVEIIDDPNEPLGHTSNDGGITINMRSDDADIFLNDFAFFMNAVAHETAHALQAEMAQISDLVGLKNELNDKWNLDLGFDDILAYAHDSETSQIPEAVSEQLDDIVGSYPGASNRMNLIAKEFPENIDKAESSELIHEIDSNPQFDELSKLFYHNFYLDRGYISFDESKMAVAKTDITASSLDETPYYKQPIEEISWEIGQSVSEFVETRQDAQNENDQQNESEIKLDVAGGEILMLQDPGRAYDPSTDRIAGMMDGKTIGKSDMQEIQAQIADLEASGYEPTIYDESALETFSMHAEMLYMQDKASMELVLETLEARSIYNTDAKPATESARNDTELMQAYEERTTAMHNTGPDAADPAQTVPTKAKSHETETQNHAKPAQEDEISTYTVQPGDSLSVIVQDHYEDPADPMDWSEIKELSETVADKNGIDNINEIQAGQTLRLPSEQDLTQGADNSDQPKASKGDPEPGTGPTPVASDLNGLTI